MLTKPNVTLGLCLVLLLPVWLGGRTVTPPEGNKTLEGEVSYLRATVGNGRIVTVDGQRVLLSPYFGTLDIRRGDRLRMTGFVRSWGKNRWFTPCSRAQIQELEQTTQPLKDMESQPKGTRARVLATPLGLEEYVSRKGLRHLRFRLQDGGCELPAIMFEGTFDSADRQRLAAGQPIEARVRVDQYRKKVSLVVERLYP